jgi:hypothetical protein
MLFDVMGFGHAPDSTDYLAADPSLLGSVFQAPIMLVADSLGAVVEDWTFDRSTWTTPEAFEIPAGRIDAGTTAALRFGATGRIAGGSTLTVEHITRLCPQAAPEWPADRGWRVQVSGSPSMLVEAKVAVDGEDENDQACLGTAMHAVHAIAPVCSADPGIRTFADLPTVVGRHVFGALRRQPALTPSPRQPKGDPS